jgi:hypothetical protein
VEEKRHRLQAQKYLVYQPIINHRTADALVKLKKCFNFANTNWVIIKGAQDENIKTSKRESIEQIIHTHSYICLLGKHG